MRYTPLKTLFSGVEFSVNDFIDDFFWQGPGRAEAGHYLENWTFSGKTCP